MATYKAAPRKVKATIIEGLAMQHALTFKDLEEGLGVTRWQWNNAQLAIQKLVGAKKKRLHVHWGGDEATVSGEVVDFV